MKRPRDNDSSPPIKRQKSEDITKYIPKIHDALDGQSLTDVHTPYGTSFCLFFIPSPPLYISDTHISRLVDIHSALEFVIFKGNDSDTLTIQVDLTPLIDNTPVGKLMDQTLETDTTHRYETNEQSIETLDDRQKRIIRWMQSFGTFEFDFTHTEKTITLQAKTYQSKLHGNVLVELDKIRKNDFYKSYRILLSSGRLAIRFQTV